MRPNLADFAPFWQCRATNPPAERFFASTSSTHMTPLFIPPGRAAPSSVGTLFPLFDKFAFGRIEPKEDLGGGMQNPVAAAQLMAFEWQRDVT